MTDISKNKAANMDTPVRTLFQAGGLAGLFDEMTALMAVMPGKAFDPNAKVSTEEETEAMFDNMPV